MPIFLRHPYTGKMLVIILSCLLLFVAFKTFVWWFPFWSKLGESKCCWLCIHSVLLSSQEVLPKIKNVFVKKYPYFYAMLTLRKCWLLNFLACCFLLCVMFKTFVWRFPFWQKLGESKCCWHCTHSVLLFSQVFFSKIKIVFVNKNCYCLHLTKGPLK